MRISGATAKRTSSAQTHNSGHRNRMTPSNGKLNRGERLGACQGPWRGHGRREQWVSLPGVPTFYTTWNRGGSWIGTNLIPISSRGGTKNGSCGRRFHGDRVTLERCVNEELSSFEKSYLQLGPVERENSLVWTFTPNKLKTDSHTTWNLSWNESSGVVRILLGRADHDLITNLKTNLYRWTSSEIVEDGSGRHLCQAKQNDRLDRILKAGRHGALVHGFVPTWWCRKCRGRSAIFVRFCTTCNSRRQSTDHEIKKWLCLHCLKEGDEGASLCGLCRTTWAYGRIKGVGQKDWLCKICGVPWAEDVTLCRKCLTPRKYCRKFAWGDGCEKCGYSIEFKGDDCGGCGNSLLKGEWNKPRTSTRNTLSDVPYVNNEYEKERLTNTKSLIRSEWISIVK